MDDGVLGSGSTLSLKAQWAPASLAGAAVTPEAASYGYDGKAHRPSATVELDGAKLTFEPEALREVVRQAVERKTGARGLRSIMERALQQAMFDLPGRKDVGEVVVTAATVRGEEPARMVPRKKKASADKGAA